MVIDGILEVVHNSLDHPRDFEVDQVISYHKLIRCNRKTWKVTI